MGAGAQALEASSAALPGTLAGSWTEVERLGLKWCPRGQQLSLTQLRQPPTQFGPRRDAVPLTVRPSQP